MVTVVMRGGGVVAVTVTVGMRGRGSHGHGRDEGSWQSRWRPRGSALGELCADTTPV
jgi:hypothetical protein